MVLHFEGKNEDMNSIPSNLREHYSQPHFYVKIFYLHNGPLLFDNLYFMYKQNINTNHNFYNFISNMYLLIKLVKI